MHGAFFKPSSHVFLLAVIFSWGSRTFFPLCFVWVPALQPVSHFIKFKIQVANFRGSKWAVKFLQHGWLWMHLALFHFLGFLTGMYYQHFISVATRVTLQADSAVSFKLRSSKTASITWGGKKNSQQQQQKKNTTQQLERWSRVSQSVAVESWRLPEMLFSSVKNIFAVPLW